jgi:mono/diheme cytochrome c family protein
MFGAKWWAPSLSDPLQSALSETPTSAIIQLLKTGRSGEHHTTGPMGEVVQYSTQFLTDADLQAMAMYLQSNAQPAAQSQQPAATALQRVLPDVATRGAKIYEQHCAQCHGEQGQGQAGAYPALAGHRAVLQKDTTNLVQTVLYGGYPPATAGNPRPFGMPPYILTLDDKDIAAVLTHLRTQWGNHATEVTPLEIHRIRAGQGS